MSGHLFLIFYQYAYLDAYLELCNNLKEDFKNINDVKEVADRINYFKN
jgi:hypothetical protein